MPASSCVPTMTEATASTSVPVPMEMSKYRWYWHMMQPESATSALAMDRPRILTLPASLASVATRVALSPVARSRKPERVARYASISSLTARVTTARMMTGA